MRRWQGNSQGPCTHWRSGPKRRVKLAELYLKRRARPFRLFLLELRLARHRHDSQSGDAVALAAENAKAETVEGETLAAFGDRARLMNHQAGDGGRLFIWKIPVHRAVEIADRHRAVDHYRAVRLRAHAGHHDVVLVGNIADDLLQDILQRHHAFDFAVFVHHKREMSFAAAERL